jgi:hypothetical protein
LNGRSFSHSKFESSAAKSRLAGTQIHRQLRDILLFPEWRPLSCCLLFLWDFGKRKSNRFFDFLFFWKGEGRNINCRVVPALLEEMAVVVQDLLSVRPLRLQSAVAVQRQISNSTSNQQLTFVTSASNSVVNMPDASRGDPPSPPPNPPPSPSTRLQALRGLLTISFNDGYLG